MKVFCIGDIVSAPGREIIHSHLENIIQKYNIDLTIANEELNDLYRVRDAILDLVKIV